MSGRCDCRYCAGSSPAAVDGPVEPEPIELPDQPTPIRVHTAGMAPMDCTLHPDGTLTRIVRGELLRNLMSFADMRERGWRHARIEFNPPPLPDPAPASEPAVQEPLL
jgi:hypothetical protein